MAWFLRLGVAVFGVLVVLACGSSDGGAGSGDDEGSGGASGGSAGVGGDSTRGGSTGDAVGGSGSPSGTAPSVDEFCARWIDEFAAYMARCACEAGAVENYRESAASFCAPTGFLGALPAAVAAGDMTYDGDAALALFDRLREPEPSCVEEPFRALNLDSVELYSLGGVFVGTHELGEPCAHPVGFKGGVSDCRAGVCASDGLDAGVCIEFVGLGEACDSSGDENFDATVPRLCHEVRAADIDGEYESAFDSLLCAASTADPAVRVCVRDLPDGAACPSSAVCASGLCLSVVEGLPVGVCTAKAANGAPCDGHAHCASGACQNGEPRVCGALLGEGEPCDYSSGACASGFCNDLLSTGVCGPAPSRAVGESCTSSSDCITAGSGNAREGTCRDGRCINVICAEYLE